VARNINLVTALELAAIGVAVLPVRAADKHPLIKEWPEQSTCDARIIRQWWTAFKDAAVGIDLGKAGLIVLDGDNHALADGSPGPNGPAALAALLSAQPSFSREATPAVKTPGNGHSKKPGVHVYFRQNGQALGNSRGNLPDGIDVRGAGGYVVAPGAVLSRDLVYRAIPETPDFITAYRTGAIPELPQGVIDLIRAPKPRAGNGRSHGPASNSGANTIREQSYAQATLKALAAELAAAAPGTRNQKLNDVALRLGHMVARGWIDREEVEEALLQAAYENDYVSEHGLAAAEKTPASGLSAGEAAPHPDLPDDGAGERVTGVAPDEVPLHPPCTLDQLHATFRKWLGAEYDLDTIDAVLAAAVSERLGGDPLWLLVISGPGNAKTETVQALSGAGAHVTSTITSEGALLSASSRKDKVKEATGGLLRKVGDRGVLVLKDVTSILSADRNTRASVLAAIREIYDGRWERNVGIDGGRTLTWAGRLVLVGAVTSAWDMAHTVVSAMGDRFVLIRASSKTGRAQAGLQALRNVGHEVIMRQELAAAVGGVLQQANTADEYTLSDSENMRLMRAADIVTVARTAVERDMGGNVLDSHDPEVPTRFVKQLSQVIRGAVALGMSPAAGMRLAIRCARDSIPPLRRAILLDIAAHPASRPGDVRKRLSRPWRTVQREMEGLFMLGLLHCVEEEVMTGDKLKTSYHYSLAADFDRSTLLAMNGLSGPS
jgi:hypothetical protein